ncbi:helix-turn-helix domain-containing protein [Endozoicomonas elysicola]|uniref:AraC family transcriptional regulator n=2 Tax=Endozoicomonas elysicola TaxID=305900 RepID=A0A081KFJ5_9GAMM|nr:helix-turn-helix transcriptional regulator [Endozoicomonas elysicola]KEI72921.1 AraC family transcriptional regulator [Endozoicomonas elysicola]
MINWKQPPDSAQIAQYVECYWFLEKQTGVQSHPFPKLNPDPAGHLIIAPADQTYRYNVSQRFMVGKGSHWLFPHSQTYQMDHTKPFSMIGIKFHIGALYSLDITPEQPVLDQVVNVDLNRQFHPEAVSTTDLLHKSKLEIGYCVTLLDEWLMPWLSKAHQDKHSKLTRAALPLLSSHSITDIGDLLHCSQRTLERSFSRVTGFTLKQCQSMNRLETMLEYLYLNREMDINWGDIACQFGFSDQPHLIRYLKRAIGETPGEYARLRDLTIDIYGAFLSH